MSARLFPLMAVALSAMFFAIAFYINIGEQPARLALADAPLLEQWKISFRAGFLIQSSLAIVSGCCGLASWWLVRDWRLFAGGLLMLANWPWTLLAIAPINQALLATSAQSAGPASRALIEQWGAVHAGRTFMACMALIMFVWAFLRSERGSTDLPA